MSKPTYQLPLRRYSNCRCGRPKDKRAKQCRACKDKEPEKKRCPKCGRERPIGEFQTRTKGGEGRIKTVTRRSRCHQCENAAGRECTAARTPEQRAERRRNKRLYDRAHPQKVLRWGLRSNWRQKGFDPDVVEAFLAAQPKCCAICGAKSGNTKNHRLSIDHDHDTNKLRALLCGNCNRGLGFFAESIPLLEAAIAYLRRHKIVRIPIRTATGERL